MKVQIKNQMFFFEFRALFSTVQPNPKQWRFEGCYDGEKTADYVVPNDVDVIPVWRKEAGIQGRNLVGFYSEAGIEKIRQLVDEYKSPRNDAGGKANSVSFDGKTILCQVSPGYGCCIDGLSEVEEVEYSTFLPLLEE